MENEHTCRNCRWSRPKRDQSGDLDCLFKPPVVVAAVRGSYLPGVRPNDYCSSFEKHPAAPAIGAGPREGRPDPNGE